VDSSFARQIAEIEAGLREPVISVGNLEAIRDFTDVRDIVWGYWLATEQGEPGEVYNLCSGIGFKISTVLMHLISLSTVRSIEIKEDPARMRPSDLPVLVGNFLKFKKQTGWQPVTSYLEKTLPSILDYWRKKIWVYDNK
jgi:GDP-4-dehydro-6-deoxy-D-mannose reductase